MRKRYGAKFKTKVAIEAIKSDKPMSALSTEFEVSRDLVQKWKKIAQDGIPTLFADKKLKGVQNSQKITDELYKQIGQLKVENDWLKKKL